MALGLEANQSVQPRPVCADKIEIAHARRQQMPNPPIQAQISANRRLSEQSQFRRVGQDQTAPTRSRISPPTGCDLQELGPLPSGNRNMPWNALGARVL